MVDRTDLAWNDLGSARSNKFAGIDVVSKTYAVSHTDSDRVTEVRRRVDSSLVVRHEAAHPEYVTVFADLAGDKLVIVDEDNETNGDGVKDLADSYIYDLRTGKSTKLSSIVSAPRASVFGRQATVTDDGRYYYSANVKHAKNEFFNCVGMLDLTTMLGSSVECAGDGENEAVGYFVGAGDNGATWLHIQGPTIQSCRTGRGTKGTQLITVGPADGCATLGTATVGGWSVWSATATAAGALEPNIALRATDGTTTVELGYVNGVALTMCGSFAYWRIEDRPSQSIQLRRWKPGLKNVEVAYKQSTPGEVSAAYQLGLGGCADSIFTLQVFTVDSPKNLSEIRVLTLDSH